MMEFEPAGLGDIEVKASAFKDCLVVATKGPVSDRDATVPGRRQQSSRGVGLLRRGCSLKLSGSRS